MKDKENHIPYTQMTNNQLEDHVKKNHYGETLGEFSKDGGLYNEVLKRNLIDKIVKDKVLIRRKKQNGFFKDKTNKQFEDHIRINYFEKSLSELKEIGTPYVELRRRKLTDKFVKKGILVRIYRKRGTLENRTNNQLKIDVRKNHYGKSIREFAKTDSELYEEIRKRGLLCEYVKEGILVNKKNKSRYQNLDEVITKIKEIMQKYNFKNLLPQYTLTKLKCYDLIYAINKFSGSYRKFKELFNQRLGIASEKQQLENLLDGYIKQ